MSIIRSHTKKKKTTTWSKSNVSNSYTKRYFFTWRIFYFFFLFCYYSSSACFSLFLFFTNHLLLLEVYDLWFNAISVINNNLVLYGFYVCFVCVKTYCVFGKLLTSSLTFAIFHWFFPFSLDAKESKVCDLRQRFSFSAQ